MPSIVRSALRARCSFDEMAATLEQAAATLRAMCRPGTIIEETPEAEHAWMQAWSGFFQERRQDDRARAE
jgi:hypothetical protein